MVCDPTELSEVRLEIVRWQLAYERVWRWLFVRWPHVASHWVGSLLSSFMIAAVPLTVTGVTVCLWTYSTSGFRPLSLGVICALVEIGITPFLLRMAIEDAYAYLRELKPKFGDADMSEKLRRRALESLRRRSRFFVVVPLMIVFTLLAIYYIFNEYVWGVKLWGAAAALCLGYLAGIGTWSIIEMVRLNNRVCASDLKLEPFHPDESGGLKILGDFCTKCTLYFFTAVLYFPIVWEFIAALGKKTEVGWVFAAASLGAFALVGLYAFFTSQFAIRSKIRSLKYDCILSSQKDLEVMMSRLERGDDSLGIAEIARPATHYFIYHRRLMVIKEWPYDFVAILRLAFSFLLPLAIYLLERYLR